MPEKLKTFAKDLKRFTLPKTRKIILFKSKELLLNISEALGLF